MRKNYNRKTALATLLIAGGIFATSTFASAASSSYENSVSFESTMPDYSGNTSLCSSKKTTNRKYGKIEVDSFKNFDSGKGINCWFRVKVDGNYYYNTDDYMVKVRDKKAHKVCYYDTQKKYYKEGVSATMRAENEVEEFTLIFNPTVKGTVFFN